MTLPAQVAEQAALADELQKNIGAVPQPEQLPQDTPPETAKPVPEAVEQPVLSENEEEKFRNRYYSLKGKYDGEVPALSKAKKDLEAQLQAMREENLKLRQEASEYRRKGNGLTQKDEELLGADIVDAIRRGSSEAVGQLSADFEAVKAENEKLRAQNSEVVEQAKRAAMQEWKERTLDRELPDWRSMNQDPEFLEWLSKPIPGSNVPKHVALGKADAECDIPFIINVFKKFKAEKEGVKSPALSRQVQPTESRGTVTPSGQQTHRWTQAKVAELYDKARRGEFTSEQFAQLENELNDVLAKNNGQLPPY